MPPLRLPLPLLLARRSARGLAPATNGSGAAVGVAAAVDARVDCSRERMPFSARSPPPCPPASPPAPAPPPMPSRLPPLPPLPPLLPLLLSVCVTSRVTVHGEKSEMTTVTTLGGGGKLVRALPVIPAAPRDSTLLPLARPAPCTPQQPEPPPPATGPALPSASVTDDAARVTDGVTDDAPSGARAAMGGMSEPVRQSYSQTVSSSSPRCAGSAEWARRSSSLPPLLLLQ